MQDKPQNVGASVRARLLNHAKSQKLDFNLVLTRYGIERLIYRISLSRFSSQFVLKGALLSVFVKKVVRFSKRLPPRFLATSDAPAAG